MKYNAATVRPPLWYLYLTAFAAGVTTLAVELSASRLLGTVFGTSNLVWANIIGLILVYLSLGYFLGGRWADRSPSAVTFYRLTAWAAFTSGLIPLVARPVLLLAARAVERFDAAVIAGSFIAMLALFSIPVTLLGCVSPFLIRLALRRVSDAGSLSGKVFAVSTLGSIVGAFAPVLVLIPTIGTARTFLAFAGGLLAVALIGLAWSDLRQALRHLWMPPLLALLAWLALRGPLKPTAGLLYEGESAYNFIQVVQRGDTRYLLLNEGQGVHSQYTPGQLLTNGTWDYFLAAPFFNPSPHSPAQVKSLGLVGLAAGTIARQYTAAFGPIPIDGIEIDPQIVEVGRDFFAMNEPNLNVIVGDGRYALGLSRRTYSVIGVDAYRLPYIPWQLTTREFFAEARAHLTPDGVAAINVGRAPDDRRLVDAMVGTLSAVFASVFVMDVPGTFNSILVATVRPASPDDLRANFAGLDRTAHPLLAEALARALAGLQPTPRSTTVFTDDLAPVEQLTNSIVIRFVLEGGMSELE